MALTKVSGEVIKRPLVLTGDASISGIMTVGTGSTTTTIDGSFEYPTVRPTLDLNFAATKTLDRRITFTRDSFGSYVGEDGLIKYAPNNTPRFDHDPNTHESLGLLIEVGRTNIQKISTIRQSGAGSPGARFSINTASEQTAGENTNGIVGPDGTAKGVCRLFFTGSETDPDGSVYVAAGTGSGTGADFTTTNTHTSSVWIRPGLETEWKFQAHSAYASSSAAGSATNIDFIFTLTGDGTVTSIQTGGISATVKKYPNNWYRCSITYHRNSTATVSSGWAVLVYPNVYNTYNAQSQTGDIGWVWGAQVEEGTFPTSYIPTSGSTVNRTSDIAKITGTNFTSFYSSEEFTLYGDGRSITGSSDLTGNPAMVSIDDNTNSNRFILRRWDPGSADPRSGFTFRYYRSDISLNMDAFPHATTGYDATGDMPDWQDALLHKMAFAVNNNSQVPHDIAGYGDGYSADFGVTTPGGYTGTETLTPYTAATQMQIGFGASSARWNGHISSIKYYPKRLSNAQLKGLTSQ